MSETLLSLGLDVGTTSTQMIFSRLEVENRASGFSVPELEISSRTVLHRSPVYFTPLLDENRVDGEKLRDLVAEEFRKAGISKVDTGAVIITGETGRKENARAVLENISAFAGDFVVATAGPELESVLAAKGAGCMEASEGQTLLHMDIGGGTSNLCLLRDGKILDTGCLNVGGRLVKFGETVTYVSPVLAPITDLRPGDVMTEKKAEDICGKLTAILEMAAGLREKTREFDLLITREGKPLDPEKLSGDILYSFSGGVADCIGEDKPWDEFGDLGPTLGRCIRRSRLHPCRLGGETIRATVIGAGCHSAQLSGSTVFCQNVAFPLKNLRAVEISMKGDIPSRIRSALSEGPAVLAMEGIRSPNYPQVSALAVEISEGLGENPAYICLEQDMAKALGQALALRLGKNARILCLDRVKLGPESYLDVAAPVGPALPVVVKTLILGKEG